MPEFSFFMMGVLGSFLAGAMTGVGALPVFCVRGLSHKVQDMLLGFGAGVMLALTSFSLIIPGYRAAFAASGHTQAALIMTAGVLLGGVFLHLADKHFPHEHFFTLETEDQRGLKRVSLFVVAMTLHNLPEGVAVGVGFAGGDFPNGLTLALGTGLHNLAEGLVLAMILMAAGYPAWRAIGISFLTGMAEPVGGILGAGAVTLARPLLPWGMAFAAGAMLFVTADELIPEARRRGFEKEATSAIMAGFVVMMFIEFILE